MLYGLLAVVLMAMDHRGHYVPRLRDLAQHAAEPLYLLIEWPQQALRDLSGYFRSQHALLQERDRLSRELLARRGELQRMQALEQENSRLRALFAGAQSQPYDYRFAEMLQVDLDPFSHRVLIDLGSADGVQPGQAVIDGSGVVGQVEDVQRYSASVRLISDPNHALPVQINRTGLRTVAFGLGETSRLSMPNVPREADVRSGDLVVTSGLGERFPGGYPVAVVTSIDREAGLTFARVEAAPLAALDRGREVLLIETPEIPEKPATPDAEAPEAETAEHETPDSGMAEDTPAPPDGAAEATDEAADEPGDPAAPTTEQSP
jgi:rod shape-determining protein MreC